MPLIDGKSLGSMSWSIFSQNSDDIFKLVFQIFSLVASIRNLNICHADISSSNFMLSQVKLPSDHSIRMAVFI